LGDDMLTGLVEVEVATLLDNGKEQEELEEVVHGSAISELLQK